MIVLTAKPDGHVTHGESTIASQRRGIEKEARAPSVLVLTSVRPTLNTAIYPVSIAAGAGAGVGLVYEAVCPSTQALGAGAFNGIAAAKVGATEPNGSQSVPLANITTKRAMVDRDEKIAPASMSAKSCSVNTIN